MPGRNALSRKSLFLVGGLRISAHLKGSVLVGCLMPGNFAILLGSWDTPGSCVSSWGWRFLKVRFLAVVKQDGSLAAWTGVLLLTLPLTFSMIK